MSYVTYQEIEKIILKKQPGSSLEIVNIRASICTEYLPPAEQLKVCGPDDRQETAGGRLSSDQKSGIRN